MPDRKKQMRPEASSAAVRTFMQRMPRANTTPEVALRRELHRLGVRFRLHRKDLPGRPDIVVVGLRLVIFVDGCFWHGCPEHAVAPKANAEWWAEKIAANQERDRRKDAELRALEWKVLHVWEHEEASEVAARIARWWKRREK